MSFEEKALQRDRVYQINRIKETDLPEPVRPRIAEMFCEWVGGALPTTIQWEYAVRGPESLLYPWGNEWDPLKGNFADVNGFLPRPDHLQHYSRFTPVDAYPEGVSPFGLYDMMGNMPEYASVINPNEQGPFWYVHGKCLKDRTIPPAWFFYMAFQKGTSAWYTGFRPVRNQWPRSLWPGFEAQAA